MKRREFIKFSACGLSVVAVGSVAQWPGFWPGGKAWASSSHDEMLELEMVEAMAEMVDGVRVPMWAFKLASALPGFTDTRTLARIPGPAIFAMEGDHVQLHISNDIRQGGRHGFAIPGVMLQVDGRQVERVEIARGDDVHIEFHAPAPGTYMYLDPFNAPVNRVMGLHGALVVLPNPLNNRTPFADPTNEVRLLFNHLGTTEHFPGHPWDPARNAVWVFNTVDPVKNALAAANDTAIAPSNFLGGYLPQYFTINGKSGFFGSQHHHTTPDGGDNGDHDDDHDHAGDRRAFDLAANISIRGRVGQPIVIRNLNAGLMWHSPHIHGNHVYPLSHADVRLDAVNGVTVAGERRILDNLLMVDTWAIPPATMEDVLLTYIAPPDIPSNFWARVAAGTNEELLPLFYPMHDHNEISNTAAGGNYPHGLTTHWQIDEPFDPTDVFSGVISVTRARLRVKTGRLELEGLYSAPGSGGVVILDVHAGGASGPLITDHVPVDGQGRWSYRGRALKALGSNLVTIMFHDPVNRSTVHAGRTVRLELR
ncbi:multicopper oxidase domain-containing protein [Geoalkalibacter sp.]|uniref:multicopper oxidase domain-containing protein n=1 Tax=Geoalkalibacter sp. TaxID=3041440 RepID=UPI00272E869F|nr:multicopper oxidase domain-containing protein [Geoalkalibacter sp.]